MFKYTRKDDGNLPFLQDQVNFVIHKFFLSFFILIRTQRNLEFLLLLLTVTVYPLSDESFNVHLSLSPLLTDVK